MANEKRLIEIPSDGIIRIPIMNGEDTVGERCIDLSHLPTVDAVEVVHGRWINTPPYRASNGNYNKAQECSVCHSLFVSPGNTPYSNHPYCCECGAKMDLEV
jgi:hypothetical protein